MLWTGQAGGRGVLVAGTEPPDVVELWDWTLGPGDQHVSETHVRGTKELLQVQEGSITVEVGDQVGDPGCRRCGRVPGRRPPRYANPTAPTARFSLAVFEPGVRRRPPRRGGVVHG